ncbi:MAG: hypothetical protein NVS3B14_18660 [Ktedonobacteraceae bacterium]
MRHVVHRTRQEARRYWMPLAALVLLFAMVLIAAGVVQFPRQAAHAATVDWPTFLGSNARTGYNGQETTINPTTAPNLKELWTDQTSGHVSSEPLIVNGVLYWGSWDGLFHATDPTTGKDIWAKNLGQKPGSCGQSYGFVGSATVASITLNGVPTQAVFVAGGQDNVTALDTSTGNIIWQTNLGTNKAEFLYDSTSVFNSSVYVGVSSFGDCPLIQGQVVQLNAVTGTIQNTFNVVPKGCVGGAVWGSLTIDETTGMLYFGTGNASPFGCKNEPLGSALVELNASNLSLVASWQLTNNPSLDYDIGSTPTLFNATINGAPHAMVGFVSKDGNYYAFDRTNIGNGPLWKATISVGGSGPETGNGSISAGSYDGTYLYQAGGITTISGQKCTGSLRAMDPNTGNFIWQMCLGSPVLGPVISVPGLVVVGWAKNLYVVDSASGQKLFSYVDTTSLARFWGAATISNGVLYVGSRSGKLFAFGLPNTPTPTPTLSPTVTSTPTPTTPPGTTLAQESFPRPNQSLWGTASDGLNVWGADANTLSNFSINTNSGQVAGSGSQSRGYTGVLGPAVANAQVQVSGSLSAYGGNTLGAVLRWSNGNNFYKAYLTGSALILLKKVNGAITRLKSVSFAATAGTSYTLLFSVSGSTLNASVWATNGGSNPGTWMLTATDSSLASGNCGVLVFLASTATADFTAFLATSQ